LRCSQPLVDGRLDCHINDPKFAVGVWDGGCVRLFNGGEDFDTNFRLPFIGPRLCAWVRILSGEDFPDSLLV
jgi:hypothetical protein